MIHQIDSKYEWLLLSASFAVKFGLVFVLTMENTFSQRFHFKVNKKSMDPSKNWCWGFLGNQNLSLVESTKIENALFPYKPAISEANAKINRVVSTKWTYHKEQSFSRNYCIFLKILFQFKDLP